MADREETRKVIFSDLLGSDLTGKTVKTEVSRMGKLIILSTDKALSVISDEVLQYSYRLQFPIKYEACFEGKCSHSNKNAECLTDEFQGYSFAGHKEFTVTEIIPVEETSTYENKATKKEQVLNNDKGPDYHGMLMRETNRVLPELYRTMIGSGGLSLDTDSMSLADPRDRHHLEWLARIAAGFVLAEQARWEPQLEEALTTVAEYKERTGDLERLLDSMREAAEKEDVTVEELKELIGKYRNPLENHYDKMRERKKRADMMESWAQEIMSSDAPQKTENSVK